MAKYDTKDIRNVAIVGQSGAGKTSLAEAMLFITKSIKQLGSVPSGNTTMDYEPEEKKRNISVSTSFAHYNWKGNEVNILNTPGFTDFLVETRNALSISDGVLLVLDATSAVKVELERIWKFLKQLNLPIIGFVNKLDKERADFLSTIERASQRLKAKLLPIQMPIGMENSFKGVVDLILKKALTYSDDLSGKSKVGEIPEDIKDEANEMRDKLFESIVETDDALLEKYLDGQELTLDEINKALKNATLSGKIIPVLCGLSTKNYGIDNILEQINSLLPSPLDTQGIKGRNTQTNEEEIRKPDINSPFSAFVFKTIVDPFAGKISLVRIYSGSINTDSLVQNTTKNEKEKIGNIYKLIGNNQEFIGNAIAGDIVAIGKLKVTLTGDTLSDIKNPIVYPELEIPSTSLSYAIKPLSKGDEEKITASLNKLREEDITINVLREPQTKEIILSGMGQIHIDTTIEKMQRKFGVRVELQTPKVPYKETIKAKTRIQGKYKKQSGGRGQYGDVWIEIEPLQRGVGFEFVDKIFGGSIPKNYIPAVEKGIKEAMNEGVLAGFPVVDIKVTLVDGSYHVVDSSDLAFKIAGSMAFKKGVQEAKPVLLEPIMEMEINAPDDSMGDIIGNINSRRGKILGIESADNGQIVKSLVPMAEVLSFLPDLTSLTSGRGSFSMHFVQYEEVPEHIREKIIAVSKKKEEVEK